MIMKEPKVFCIGFHKTGTCSLGKALAVLGYRVCGSIGVGDSNIGKNAVPVAIETAQHYDAFEDNPWPIVFKELDQAYPGSKFILTMRSPDKWFESARKHFGSDVTPMREWIYGRGAPEGNAAVYIQRYERHYAEVLAYFRDRHDDLLVIDLFTGGNWEKLCRFLGCDIPDEPFPHFNKGGLYPKIRRKLRKAYKTVHASSFRAV